MHCTLEQSYRWSVLPLGVFMIFGGIVLFTAAMLCPAESMFVPPFQAPWTKRLVAGGISLCWVPLGLGFYLRSKIAWYAFFAFILIGTSWHVIAALLDSNYFP
jgi:hypothetical protein